MSLKRKDRIPLADILAEFLEISFHMLLFYRNLYPVEIFERSQKYNCPVMTSRHPTLNHYLGQVVTSIKHELLKDSIDRVALVVLRNESIKPSNQPQQKQQQEQEQEQQLLKKQKLSNSDPRKGVACKGKAFDADIKGKGKVANKNQDSNIVQDTVMKDATRDDNESVVVDSNSDIDNANHKPTLRAVERFVFDMSPLVTNAEEFVSGMDDTSDDEGDDGVQTEEEGKVREEEGEEGRKGGDERGDEGEDGEDEVDGADGKRVEDYEEEAEEEIEVDDNDADVDGGDDGDDNGDEEEGEEEGEEEDDEESEEGDDEDEDESGTGGDTATHSERDSATDKDIEMDQPQRRKRRKKRRQQPTNPFQCLVVPTAGLELVLREMLRKIAVCDSFLPIINSRVQDSQSKDDAEYTFTIVVELRQESTIGPGASEPIQPTGFAGGVEGAMHLESKTVESKNVAKGGAVTPATSNTATTTATATSVSKSSTTTDPLERRRGSLTGAERNNLFPWAPISYSQNQNEQKSSERSSRMKGPRIIPLRTVPVGDIQLELFVEQIGTYGI